MNIFLAIEFLKQHVHFKCSPNLAGKDFVINLEQHTSYEAFIKDHCLVKAIFHSVSEMPLVRLSSAQMNVSLEAGPISVACFIGIFELSEPVEQKGKCSKIVLFTQLLDFFNIDALANGLNGKNEKAVYLIASRLVGKVKVSKRSKNPIKYVDFYPPQSDNKGKKCLWMIF